jgi:hypothetical protein
MEMPGRTAAPGVLFERGTTLGTADTATFAVAEVVEHGRPVLWFGRLAAVTQGRPTWSVTDTLALPTVAEDQWLMLAICGTPRRGTPVPAEPEDLVLDPEIVAIVRSASVEVAVLNQVEHAWRASRTTGRFEPISASGIACLNDRELEH